MAFDGITVACVVTELKKYLIGARIHKITQPEPDEIILCVNTNLGVKRLVISANASLSLIYLTDENRNAPFTAPNFCMSMRKRLQNGRIAKITQPDFDRAVRMKIISGDEMGDPRVYYLISEFMGKHSNIILCDDKERIIDSIKHISFRVSSVREVLPGRMYFIPRKEGVKNPLTCSRDDFKAAIKNAPYDLSLSKAMYTGFLGISPLVADEIAYIAGIDPDAKAGTLSEKDTDLLSSVFQSVFDKVKGENFSPVIYYEKKGDPAERAKPAEFSCVPLSRLSDRYEKVPYTSVSLLIKTFYFEREIALRISQKSANLKKTVKTALERCERKMALQEKELSATLDREDDRVFGELINTYGYGLHEGEEVLRCVNFYNGKEVSIPIDTSLSVSANAGKYFERYARKKRTAEAIEPLIKETEREIDYLKSVLTSLEIARDDADLAEIEEELSEAGFIKIRNVKKHAAQKSKPLHYISTDGYHMYVGKNNLQNEEITFRLAAPDDWWFHAKGRPGSHVIVKANGTKISDRTFEEAARLAAHYSQNSDSGKAEVDYVQRKHIKKPAGQKPGYVIYHMNYSMMADSDISQLKIAPD